MSIYGLGDIHISADTKIGNLTPLSIDSNFEIDT